MSALKSKTYVPQHVLFIQGAFKRNCNLPDMTHESLISGLRSPLDTKIYDKIPVNFISVDTWFKSTNICCWFCSRHFKTRPWFEPQSIEPLYEVSSGGMLSSKDLNNPSNKKNTSIVIMGIFCSCNCVRSFIDTYTKDLADRHNKIEMLKYVYELFNGKKISDIQPSPSPTEMIQYGGYLTSVEYQQKIDQLDIAYQKELEDNNFSSLCNMFKKQQTVGIY